MGVSLGTPLVQMHVHVRLPVMVMSMQMESSASFQLEQEVAAQHDQHHCHAKFHPQGHTIRDGEFEQNDRQAEQGEGRRVPRPPEGADKGGAGEALLFAHDGGNGDDVIRVEGMLDAQDQSETKWSK